MNSLIAGLGIDLATVVANAACPEKLIRLVVPFPSVRPLAPALGRVRIAP